MNESSECHHNRLLVVDDEKDIADYVSSVGRRTGFATAVVRDKKGFLETMADFLPTVIVLDLKMPDSDGIEFLKLLHGYDTDAQVILVSGVDERTIATASQYGRTLGLDVFSTIQKPIHASALRRVLRKLKKARPRISLDDIAQGIKSGHFRPYYQPKASCSPKRKWQILEAEALARWHRGAADIVLPGRFIALAEEGGLLPDLTFSITTQVIQQMVDWDRNGLSLSVSVNLSPSMLTIMDFPDRLEALTRQAGIANSRLTIEITEKVAVNEAANSMEVLSRLRIKGFGLAIDDFGTGHSSLAQLYRLPFNELKIDTSFVRECDACESARTIVEATVLLGQRLGLTVCAEGVESQNTLDFLTEVGCDKAQGFHISPAVPAEEFERVTREWNAVATGSAVVGQALQ